MNLSIIIPAHNEEKRIRKTLEEYVTLFKEKEDVKNFEIIVVANACKDKTVEIVKKFIKKNKEIKILDFEKGGKGFAIKEGFKEALKGKAELIGFVDADNATPAFAFYDLVKNIDNYDGILGSRYIKNAVLNPKPTFIRFLASRIFNFLVRVLFFLPYHDTQCGAKLFRREVVEKVVPKLSMSQFAFDIDLLYNTRKLGFKIKEHPTFWRDVEYSKIKLKKASVQMFLAIIQLRILNSRLKKNWKFFKPIASTLYKMVE